MGGDEICVDFDIKVFIVAIHLTECQVVEHSSKWGKVAFWDVYYVHNFF